MPEQYLAERAEKLLSFMPDDDERIVRAHIETREKAARDQGYNSSFLSSLAMLLIGAGSVVLALTAFAFWAALPPCYDNCKSPTPRWRTLDKAVWMDVGDMRCIAFESGADEMMCVRKEEAPEPLPAPVEPR